jgi:hypothetical protein
VGTAPAGFRFPRLDSHRIERPGRRIPLAKQSSARTTKECCHRSDGIAVPIDADRCDRNNRRIRHAHHLNGGIWLPRHGRRVAETLMFRDRNAFIPDRKRFLRDRLKGNNSRGSFVTREMLSNHIFGNRHAAIPSRANPKPRRRRNGGPAKVRKACVARIHKPPYARRKRATAKRT